jgi:hypothetical protein
LFRKGTTILVLVFLVLTAISCQNLTTSPGGTTSSVTSLTSTETPASTVPASTPTTAVTTTTESSAPPATTPTVTANQTTVTPVVSTTSVPSTSTTPVVTVPVLPELVSMAADKVGADLHGELSARVTAVFRFDVSDDPGYYNISLVSGNDSYSGQTIEWYRATKQISLTWIIEAGQDAFYRLMNNEPVEDVFQSRINYSRFESLNKIPSKTPSDLELDLANKINVERNLRGLPLLTWDNDLYNQALQRLTAFGQEGMVTPPPSSQTSLEITYISLSGASEDSIGIFQSWIINEKYSGIIADPKIKSFAVRTDLYNNHRFYVVGLFK